MKHTEQSREFYSEFGKLIKQLRTDRRWSQEDLAAKVDVTVPFISNIESGLTGLDTYNFVQLCKAFDFTPNQLLCFDVALRTEDLQQWSIEVAKLDGERRAIVISTIKSMLKELDKGIEKMK